MTKYQSVEKAEVLSSEDHERIGTKLKRLGKASVEELTETERKHVLNLSE